MATALTRDDVEHCLALLKDQSTDLYLSTLLQDGTRRGVTAVLNAFHTEISNLVLGAREPMAAEIRLKWWEEVVEGTRAGEAAGHPTARAVCAIVQDDPSRGPALIAKLQAHVFDVYNDPMESRTMLEGYLGETRSALFQLLALQRGEKEQPWNDDELLALADASGHAGVTCGLVAILANLPRHRESQRIYFPAELLAAVGLNAEEFLANPGEKHHWAVAAMIDLAQDHEAKARAAIAQLSPSERPVFNQLALSQLYLKPLKKEPAKAFTGMVVPSQWRRQWALWRF